MASLVKSASHAVQHIHFPNESPQYRRARNVLLEHEMDLRRQVERVAAQRRTLPPGGEIPEDYVFEAADAGGKPKRVRLSELFAPGKDAKRARSHSSPKRANSGARKMKPRSPKEPERPAARYPPARSNVTSTLRLLCRRPKRGQLPPDICRLVESNRLVRLPSCVLRCLDTLHECLGFGIT